jgi:hypothetical protein
VFKPEDEVCSSEPCMKFNRTTRHCIPEYSTLHTYHRETQIQNVLLQILPISTPWTYIGAAEMKIHAF